MISVRYTLSYIELVSHPNSNLFCVKYTFPYFKAELTLLRVECTSNHPNGLCTEFNCVHCMYTTEMIFRKVAA